METSRSKRVLLTLLHPKVGIPLIVVLLMLSAPFVFRARQIAGLPDPGDPFDVEAFGTVEITPEENAFVEYASATAILVPLATTNDDDLSKAMEGGWSAASEEVRKWVSDNRAALEIWREGTRKAEALYHQPKNVDYDTLLPVVQEMRTFSKLARLVGARLEEADDLDGARDWYRAIFRSSRHSGRHGGFIVRLVGIAIHFMAADALQKWAGDPQVDAAQLRRALDDVIADYQMTPVTSTAFKVEYITFMNTLDRPDLPALLCSCVPRVRVPTKVELFLMHEPELCVRVARHVWANWLKEIDRPLYARSPRRPGRLSLFTGTAAIATGADSLTPAEIEAFFDRSPLAQALLSAPIQADLSVTREQARQQALVVTLAAHLFYRKQGRFPEKAEEMLPGILKELPQDPFGRAGESIHYRRDGDGAVVWSISLNGTDDGGTFSDNLETGDSGYRIHPPGVKPTESVSEKPRQGRKTVAHGASRGCVGCPAVQPQRGDRSCFVRLLGC